VRRLLEALALERHHALVVRQSEQIPTRVRLAVAEQVEGSGEAWRAGGLLMQFSKPWPSSATTPW
jgi:molecular chaperone Hsp33